MLEGVKWTQLISLLAFVFILWAASVFEFVICPFRHIFGFSCPGCGLTRASTAMLHGDWARMWALHPLAPLLFPLMALVLGNLFLQALGITKIDITNYIPNSVGIVLLVVLLGLWIARLTGVYGCVPEPFPPQSGLLFRLFSHNHDGGAHLELLDF